MNLYQAILKCTTEQELEMFLYDLCTPNELNAMQERWKVSILLMEGKLSYRAIHEKTGVSLTTITRIARFLKYEKIQGYKMVYTKGIS